MSVVISYYDKATIPGYMDRLYVNMASRLLAKGYTFSLIDKSPVSFTGVIQNHMRKHQIVKVVCENETIYWESF